MRTTSILILLLALWSGRSPAATFDAVAQFSGVTATGRIWSYNYALDGVTAGLVPLPDYGLLDDNPSISFTDGSKKFRVKVWRNSAFDTNGWNSWLSLGVNRTDVAWVEGGVSPALPPHTLYLLPPSQGSVVLTFTAPGRVTATVNYSFTHIECHGNGINFSLQQVRQAPYRPFVGTIDSGTLVSTSCSALAGTGTKSATVALERGDQINFIVRPNDAVGNGYDSVALTASIVTQ